MTIKQIDIPDAVKTIILNMEFCENNGQWIGKITGQLDRPTYVNTNKILEALGGKWNRSKKGHVFNSDPRSQLEATIQGDIMIVDNHDFYVTPPALATYAASLANKVYIRGGKILEPSAGDGALADALLDAGFSKSYIQTIELDPTRAGTLREKHYAVIEGDFLEHSNTYDLIVMNPPFSKSQATKHIAHAWELLNPGGQLLSIADAGITFRNDAADLRSLIEIRGKLETLPDSSFKSSGTGVKTVLVQLWKALK